MTLVAREVVSRPPREPARGLATSTSCKGSNSCLIDCVLSDQVVHETIDGETVVINLATGSYYSMEGSASDLWARLLAGETPGRSAASLSATHGGDAAAIAAAIVTFHQELFDQGLLIEEPEAPPTAGGELGTFAMPEIQVYDDLSAHLLADPVHDVERETGWPAVSPPQ